ncbi:MAG TPA: hypothetical protein VKM93_18910 [Terriglobia bacterium]|nr:hypothetical protein [Terriglobia bacterium]
MKATARLTKNAVVGTVLLMFIASLGLARALPDQPLSKDDITVLLLAASQSTKIIQTVEQRGVDFQMSPDLAKKFHDLGASDDLIEALKAGNKAATAHAATAAGTEPNSPNPPVVRPAAAPQGKPGTTILMDDGFEYSVVDYGVGQVGRAQNRPALAARPWETWDPRPGDKVR